MRNDRSYKVKNLLFGGVYFIYLIIMIMFGTSYLKKFFNILNNDYTYVLIQGIYAAFVILPIFFIVRYLGKIQDVFQIEMEFSIKAILRKVILTILFSFIVICFHFSIRPDSNFVWQNRYIYLIIILIIGTGQEEIICRGYFQGLMDRLIKNKYISIIMAGLLFSVVHMINPSNGFATMNMFQIIIRIGYYTSLHGFFNLINKETKSLAAPTIVHTVIDFVILM